jgi:hypothetical protein
MNTIHFRNKQIILTIFLFIFPCFSLFAQPSVEAKVSSEKLLYHQIEVDGYGNILPWYSTEPGVAYDHVIKLVWNFWNTMRTDKNGLPYYMNHQVWRDDFNDRRGVGGDQFSMALSSWNLLYGYTGDEAVKEEMKFIADYYLSHALSPSDATWPSIPYPYNTLIYSGIYDGDMVIGKGFTQPDKAGSFGLELVKLYKMTNTVTYPNITDQQYLKAAINIANTLSGKVIAGDDSNSPLPFKVHAITGEIGKLKHNEGTGVNVSQSSYTSNWAPTLELFLNLIQLKAPNSGQYQKAFDTILTWMKRYPMKTNKWGPFFEDIPGWSDTQINAITFAQFIMNHRELFPYWQTDVKNIFNWVYQTVGNNEWVKYGVVVVNEQTAYQTPGNSHSSRQASAELQYALLAGDSSMVTNATRQLNWATYMVNYDGANCYPRDEVWMTDGYGDYVRHFLRAMAFNSELAPSNQDHLLRSTSIIQLMEYAPVLNKYYGSRVPVDKLKTMMIQYRTFDNESTETLRMTQKPTEVWVNEKSVPETNETDKEGWKWEKMETGGLLTINHRSGNRVNIFSEK